MHAPLLSMCLFLTVCPCAGWCDVFGFVEETVCVESVVIEDALSGVSLHLNDLMDATFDVSRRVSVWSNKRGYATLLFKTFHVFALLYGGQSACYTAPHSAADLRRV